MTRHRSGRLLAWATVRRASPRVHRSALGKLSLSRRTFRGQWLRGASRPSIAPFNAALRLAAAVLRCLAAIRVVGHDVHGAGISAIPVRLNGRTRDFDSRNRGSHPRPGAKQGCSHRCGTPSSARGPILANSGANYGMDAEFTRLHFVNRVARRRAAAGPLVVAGRIWGGAAARPWGARLR